MTEQFLADTVDSSGHAHPTIGAKDPSTIIDAFLDVSAEDLKHAVVSMLSGERFHFGSMDSEPLTSEQVTKIKNVSWDCVGD